MKNTRVSLALAGLTVIAGAYAFLAPLFGFGSAAILGVAPTALGLSLAFLFLSARTRLLVIPLFLLGMASATLALVSWSVGFNEADAGAPRSVLGELFIPAAFAAIVLLGASVGIAVASRLRMRPIPRVLLGVAIGLLSVPFVIPLLLSAPVAVVVGVALMLVIGLRGRVPMTRPRASVGPGVRPLAMVALALTVLSLGYGLVAGILLAGMDAATQAMGIMAAGGNFAAVPLMAALGQKWAPGRVVPRIGLVASGLGVAVTSFVWATGFDLSGGLFLAIPAFVAVWAGTMAGVLLPYRGLALVGMSVVVAIGVAVAYFMFAFSTAGAALAVVSGALVFGRTPRLTKTKEIGAESAV